jgi:hypothetical protein
MVIKKKDEIQASALPEKFESMVKKAASYQIISSKYEELFKESKGEIVVYLEHNDDGVNVETGKALKTSVANVIYKSRDNWTIAVDKIEKMIEKGELSLSTVLNIAKIDAKKLKDCIGEAKFTTLAVNEPSSYLAITATPDFKAEVAEMFGGEVKKEETEKQVEKIKEEKKPAKKEDVKDSLKKAKAAAKTAKPSKREAAAKTIEDDLDEILK